MKTDFVFVAAGLAIAALTSTTAFAQVEATTAPGATTEVVGEVGGPEIADDTAGFTIDTVNPDDPFADLDIDPKVSRDEANAKLTVAQREELLGRCAVITANEAHYEASVATFCTSYISAQ